MCRELYSNSNYRTDNRTEPRDFEPENQKVLTLKNFSKFNITKTYKHKRIYCYDIWYMSIGTNLSGRHFTILKYKQIKTTMFINIYKM